MPSRVFPCLALSALLLSGCPARTGESPPPGPTPGPSPGPTPSLPAEPAPTLPPPTIELAPEAVTCSEDNVRHWLELEVTFSNPSSEAIPIDVSQLLAKGGCLLPVPGWSLKTRPRSLMPREKIKGRAMWDCQPPIDPSVPAPTKVTVRYFDSAARKTFEQVVPVKVLGTKGVTASFGPPVSARSFTEPVPARGGGWDVCVHGTARNATEEPIIYLPRWKARSLEPEGAPAVGIGWLGRLKTRLDPGEVVDGRLCFRFYGQGRPQPTRISIDHVVAPTTPQELDVPPGR